MKSVGVLRFPGTNCDRDVFEMCEAKDYKTCYLWHLDHFSPNDFDMLVLPGGFSYGDYLRSGALSARSPVMNSVREFAKKGGPVLGICNGFQILAESGLLPGTLVRNEKMRFVDDWVNLKIENKSPFFGSEIKEKFVKLPVAHGDGRYYANSETLDQLEQNSQIWLKYENNPNGSLRNIAGVMNKEKNVAALMPHPERAIYSWMGGVDGWGFL